MAAPGVGGMTGTNHGFRIQGKTGSGPRLTSQGKNVQLHSKVPRAKAKLRGHLLCAVPLLSDTAQDNGFVKVSLDFIPFGSSSVATAQKAIIAIGTSLLVGPTAAVDS